MRREGWDVDILAHARRGGVVIGLCGGFQMLGQRISDPEGLEGPVGDSLGLGLLDISTTLTGTKTLTAVRGHEIASGDAITGYEMHLGHSSGPGMARPWFKLAGGFGRAEGAVSASGRVRGTYLHGVFAADAWRDRFLRSLGGDGAEIAYESGVEAALEALADHLENAIDVMALFAMAQ